MLKQSPATNQIKLKTLVTGVHNKNCKYVYDINPHQSTLVGTNSIHAILVLQFIIKGLRMRRSLVQLSALVNTVTKMVTECLRTMKVGTLALGD